MQVIPWESSLYKLSFHVHCVYAECFLAFSYFEIWVTLQEGKMYKIDITSLNNSLCISLFGMKSIPLERSSNKLSCDMHWTYAGSFLAFWPFQTWVTLQQWKMAQIHIRFLTKSLHLSPFAIKGIPLESSLYKLSFDGHCVHVAIFSWHLIILIFIV